MDNRQWTLKDLNGRIYGPFATQRLVELIQKGIIDGEEFLAPQQSTDFKPISSYPEFYDLLIVSLSKEIKPLSKEEKEKELTTSSLGRATVHKTKHTALTTADDTIEIEPPTKPLKKNFAVSEGVDGPRTQKKSKEKKSKVESEVIDLINAVEVRSKVIKENLIKIILILGLLVVGVALFFSGDKETVDPGKKINLVFPQKKGEKISPEKEKEKLRVALQYFQKDTFTNYLKAQNILVGLLETNQDSAQAVALLCLTYRELWDFTIQDTKDNQVISQAVQLAATVDPVGVNGATCRAVQALVRNQYETAESVIQTVLVDRPEEAVFYEMKSSILAAQKNYESAIWYLQKTQNLWKGWTKPFFKEAAYRIKLGDKENSLKILRMILNTNPEHSESKVHLGIIELFNFQNAEQATNMILEGLEENKVSRQTTLDGYSALAAYNHRIDKKQKALEFAKKAFKLDSTNIDMKDMIIQLGGQGELQSLQSQEEELLALGDQYFKTGNYLASQAEYKTAFEINPNNSQAALKAAQSLWRLHQSLEAIEWAKKSIKSDPKNAEAYYEIIDYLSQRFDFQAAINQVSQAKKMMTKNYLINRAAALIELRRNNPSAAIGFATEALRLNDTDIQTHLILAQSHLLLLEYDKAFKFAARALELDSHSFDVQEVYSLVMSGAQSVRVAEDYVKNLITTYPGVAQYRLTLGKIYFKDQKYNFAAQTLETVLQIDAENIEALVLLGNSYKMMGDVNKALKSYLRAGSIDPSNAEPVFLIGILYYDSDKTVSQSIPYFQKVIRVNPNYPRAYLQMGLAYLKLGDYKNAIEFGTQEKRLNPRMPDPYILLGEAYMKNGSYNQAASELQQAIRQQDKNVNLRILAARAYRLSGQLEVAASMIRIASSLESGNPEVYKEQGAIFEKRGQIEEAAAAYAKYLDLKPNALDRAEIQTKIQALSGG